MADEAARAAVFVQSETLPEDTPVIKGYDFNRGVDYPALMGSFLHHGFQASHFGQAVEEINKMRKWRLSDEPIKEADGENLWYGNLRDPAVRAQVKTKIFLGFTSNMISCGNREIIRWLCEHKMVDCLVTTGGGIEEDIMKCLAHHYMGSFELRGEGLRKRGINRIGNMLVPNDNYCKLEDWMMPILDEMLKEQQEDGVIWSPQKMIKRMGERIDNPDSVWYWCAKNDIPVYCPGLTDGAVGDNIYFHSIKNPGLILDNVQDVKGINDAAAHAIKTGMLILGGGIIKHHICNANLMRNGADFTVFVNTGQEFDGSDSGARPDEAVSWGKIKVGCNAVKVYADASFILPLLVAETFAKDFKPEDGGSAAAAAAEPASWDLGAAKLARKAAEMPDHGMDADALAAMRAKAKGNQMSEEEKKERGLLYDTSKASAVREESEEEDDGAANMDGGFDWD